MKGTLQTRAFFDLTGPTSMVTASYNAGILDFVDYVNANGGIRGYQVNMPFQDNHYDAPTAVSIYQAWQAEADWASVVGIFGNGTDATKAVAAMAATDQKPLFTTSYAAELGAPVPVQTSLTLSDGSMKTVSDPGYPYIFYPGTDYSTSIRNAMQFIQQQGGNTKVAFAYCSAGYCTSPIAAGKDYANTIGLSIGPDIQPQLTDDAATIDQKVAAYFANGANADIGWMWMGNTTQTGVYFAQALARHAPTVKMIANVWGMDENTYNLCGNNWTGPSNPCIDRVIGLLPFAAYGDLRYPGMVDVIRVHDAARMAKGEDTTKYADFHYVQGYVTFYIWKIAVEKVIDAGQPVTGANIKAAFESFNSMSTGSITSPISFTANDHRPTTGANLYSINQYGTLSFAGNANVMLKAEWVGW